MTYTSRLYNDGQVKIPSEVRESLGLATGDLVSYEIRDQEVVLKRVEPFDAAFHKALSATLDEWSSPEDEEAFRDL
jgi:AbrB family looped-hinge helix DNA binding protein